ncbi:MAG TPA: ECF-type sigma factor [Blastocatellia bacterium]|nr:ECF-type sigma factor [Blastocatellia bacterium]
MSELTPRTDLLASDITSLLRRSRAGDADAIEQLLPQVYDELRRLAQFYLHGVPSGGTLQPTALVHEVYLQLFNRANIEWQNREHFFRVVGKEMRWLVVDHARRNRAQKRGNGQAHIPLEAIAETAALPERDTLSLALEEALSQLEQMHPRTAHVVELRYFVGLSEEQAAEVLQLSVRTIRREWMFAKGWLLKQMRGENV